MALASRRSLSVLVYGLVYPVVVVATAWVLSGGGRAFNEYVGLVGLVSVAGTLFLVALRGGTRAFTHDWAASNDDEALPPPLRSLLFLVMTAVSSVLAIAVV